MAHYDHAFAVVADWGNGPELWRAGLFDTAHEAREEFEGLERVFAGSPIPQFLYTKLTKAEVE